MDIVEKLTASAYVGDDVSLKNLLKNNANDPHLVNAYNTQGQTALNFAARGNTPGHFSCLVALLNTANIDIDAPVGQLQATALHSIFLFIRIHQISILLTFTSCFILL